MLKLPYSSLCIFCQGYGVVTAQTLEDRINMYISAVDKATAMNNGHQSSQLQQDIQVDIY